MQIFGDAKDFCPNLPKLAWKVLCDFCLQIFSHKDHDDLFWCDLLKRGLYVFRKRWASFCEVKQRWAPFLPGFSEILPRFLRNPEFWG